MDWLWKRLTEPSSWAGIGILVAAGEHAATAATTGGALAAVPIAAAGVVAFCKAEGVTF
jgi:hypothetical protein